MDKQLRIYSFLFNSTSIRFEFETRTIDFRCTVFLEQRNRVARTLLLEQRLSINVRSEQITQSANTRSRVHISLHKTDNYVIKRHSQSAIKGRTTLKISR